MEELAKNKINEQINVLKIEIFDIIRQEEPLVIQRDQLTIRSNAQISEINNELNRLESLKTPKVQALIELERSYTLEIIGSKSTETTEKKMMMMMA